MKDNMPHSSPQTDQQDCSEHGFTLLEILVVLAILALLIGLVAPAALHQLGGARNSVAVQSVERLGTILDMYKLDIGNYPTSEEGLDALVHQPPGVSGWSGPYIKGGKTPQDPWNQPYLYVSPSTREGHEYDLCSGGASHEHGSPGQNGMICNP